MLGGDTDRYVARRPIANIPENIMRLFRIFAARLDNLLMDTRRVLFGAGISKHAQKIEKLWVVIPNHFVDYYILLTSLAFLASVTVHMSLISNYIHHDA